MVFMLKKINRGNIILVYIKNNRKDMQKTVRWIER